MTKIYINEGVAGPLDDIIKQHGSGRRVAIIRGGASYPRALIHGVFDRVDCGAITELSGFSPNPKFEEIERGIAQIVAFNPDMVIGVGGGSILDVAKVLCCLARFEGDCDERAAIMRGKAFEVDGKIKPILVLMPTTAGSGAEATGFSVVYFGVEKFSFLHPGLIPEYAIADPALIKDAPKLVLASSAMDAIVSQLSPFGRKVALRI